MYSRLNGRAWPDLFIASPYAYQRAIEGFTDFAGMFLELKKEGVRLRKRDGTWASDHIAEQAAILELLGEAGYVAQFAVGFDEAVQLIESYLSGGNISINESKY